MFLLSPFMRLFCVCSTNMKLNNIQKLAEALVDNRADIDKKKKKKLILLTGLTRLTGQTVLKKWNYYWATYLARFQRCYASKEKFAAWYMIHMTMSRCKILKVKDQRSKMGKLQEERYLHVCTFVKLIKRTSAKNSHI